MKKVFISGVTRTPIGSFGGSLSKVKATELGATAIKGAMQKSKIPVTDVEEVFMGNVCSANVGQAPARQSLIQAGIPNTVPATTINKVCSSGMKAIMLGAQSIMLGINKTVVAGGMENMSEVPYYLPTMRWGNKYGNTSAIDGLVKDGLSNAYDDKAMGVFADETAKKYGISREEQDEFAINSYKKVAKAYENNLWKNEIVNVEVVTRKGNITVSEDEEYKKVLFDKIPKIKPVFSKDGTVTAANASTINDGACALVLSSEDYVTNNDITPIAEILAFTDAAHEPEWFTTAPIKATQKLLQQANISLNDIDFFEVNEAFANVPLAFAKELTIDLDKINIFGGAVALGHPIGVSGARIVSTLCNVLTHKQGSLGLAAICNGGGGASAMLIRLVNPLQ